MPTQECRCNHCSHTFSHLTFKGDETLPVCPLCKGKEITTKPYQEGFMSQSSMGTLVFGVPKGPS